MAALPTITLIHKWEFLLSEVSNTSADETSEAPLRTTPLKALLLRVGTTDRIALGSVLSIRTTQSAEAAMAALREFPADVLVADTSTSDYETMALLEGLRSPTATPRKGLAVICLLAESSPKRVRGLVKAGVDHVMIKPISATALSDLAQHLSENPMTQIAVPRYVGPDRRRLPDDAYTGPKRRGSE